MLNRQAKIFLGTVWYYARANTELIRRAIDQFDWLTALSNVNVDEKVYFFTKTMLNIIQNFIPQKTIIFDDRDDIICDDRDPPWINRVSKKLMIEKNLAFQSSRCSNRNMFLLEKFKALQYQLHIPSEESKEKYHTNCQVILSLVQRHWSILKIFLNNKKSLHTSSFSCKQIHHRLQSKS